MKTTSMYHIEVRCKGEHHTAVFLETVGGFKKPLIVEQAKFLKRSIESEPALSVVITKTSRTGELDVSDLAEEQWDD